MQTVLLVAYLLIVVALIAVILVQRSEGGGLGMGGNAGGLMTVRGSANLLTRTTGILAALFFVTAIALTIFSSLDRGTDTILDQATSSGQQPSTVLDALSQMQSPETLISSASAAPSSSAQDLGLPLPVTPASSAPASSAASSAPPPSASEPPASSAPAAPSSAAPPSSAVPEPSSAPAPSSAAPVTSSAAP